MLEVKNVSKAFGKIQAVDNVSFEAHTGKILGIIGKNGAGKSTIFRVILNILEPDNGEVLLDGKKYNILASNKIGFLPEEGSLNSALTVYEQMCFYGSLRGMTEDEVVKELFKWLEEFEIVEYMNRKIKELSKGNRQRLQFIVSVLHNPEVVILDEPFSGLDPLGVEAFKRILVELKQKDKIIIFSSHRMDHVEQFSDDIVILNDGKIVLKGDLKTVKSEYEQERGISNVTLNDMFIELLGGETNV